MRDFTLNVFERMLAKFKEKEYTIVTYRKFISQVPTKGKTLVLRHDVDDIPERALEMARIEAALGVSSSYYFRDVPGTFKPGLIKEISERGHEIGYHYENMSRHRGNHEKAYEDFNRSLTRLRNIAPIETISAHGGSISGFNNMELWDYHSYKRLGIIGDIILDTDYSDILYLTDTGRSWNSRYNRRDRVQSDHEHDISKTEKLMEYLDSESLHHTIFINIHPQRWTEGQLPWYKEKILQGIKNKIKYYFFMPHENDGFRL